MPILIPAKSYLCNALDLSDNKIPLRCEAMGDFISSGYNVNQCLTVGDAIMEFSLAPSSWIFDNGWNRDQFDEIKYSLAIEEVPSLSIYGTANEIYTYDKSERLYQDNIPIKFKYYYHGNGYDTIEDLVSNETSFGTVTSGNIEIEYDSYVRAFINSIYGITYGSERISNISNFSNLTEENITQMSSGGNLGMIRRDTTTAGGILDTFYLTNVTGSAETSEGNSISFSDFGSGYADYNDSLTNTYNTVNIPIDITYHGICTANIRYFPNTLNYSGTYYNVYSNTSTKVTMLNGNILKPSSTWIIRIDWRQGGVSKYNSITFKNTQTYCSSGSKGPGYYYVTSSLNGGTQTGVFLDDSSSFSVSGIDYGSTVTLSYYSGGFFITSTTGATASTLLSGFESQTYTISSPSTDINWSNIQF